MLIRDEREMEDEASKTVLFFSYSVLDVGLDAEGRHVRRDWMRLRWGDGEMGRWGRCQIWVFKM